MNILFLCHRIPYPPNKGDKIRSFNILKYLAQKHDIYLACLADNKADLVHKKKLSEYCKSVEIAYIGKLMSKVNMLFCLLTGRPLTLGYFYSRSLDKIINLWLKNKQIDVIYVFSSGAAQYVIDVNKRKVMDFCDVDSDKWTQNATQAKFPVSRIYALEAKRMRKYEALIAQKFQESILITENEKKLFETFARPRHISVVPNGVDHNYFAREKSLFDDANAKILRNKPTNLIFTGAMDYFANANAAVYFCNNILPLIKKEIASIKFYIVGNNPTREVKKLAKDNEIIVTGYVNDIRTYLAVADICVVPLRIARGIQNKILEAMSMNLPVVATSQAAKNLAVNPEIDIFVEDKPASFAQRVIDLAESPDLRKRTGTKARETIMREYDWQKNLSIIEEIISP